MKRIIYLLSIVFIVSCDDLDLNPVGLLSGDNFFNTENDALVAVNAVYVPNSLLSTYTNYLIEAPSDAVQSGEAQRGDGGATLAIFQYGAGNAIVEGVWQLLWQGITAANNVIDKVPSGSEATALQRRITGEAKFLRALYYFYTVQFWGDVPLVLHTYDGENVTRASVDEVYTQIVKDLEDAIEVLPLKSAYAASDAGRATKGAAQTLLAKVSLVWAQTGVTVNSATLYNDAVRYADEVINSGEYALEEVFTDNWQWEEGLKNGKEIIFTAHHAVSQYADGDGGNHQSHCAFAEGFANPEATNHLAISSWDFYYKYDEADQRRDGSYAVRLKNPKETDPAQPGYDWVYFRLPLFRKAIRIDDPLRGAKERNIDRIVFRLAEVYLIKAEALNETGKTTEAYAALNIVRRRAFNQTDNPSAYALSGDAAKFRTTDIRNERYFEFVYEQKRWLDLVRWKTLIETVKDVEVEPSAGAGKQKLKTSVSKRNYRFPIPQTERDKNPDGLWQNYGYEGSTAPEYDATYR